jgi:hypothetical protein
MLRLTINPCAITLFSNWINGGLEMNANKWVAMLATCSVLATAAPVSAQFGGLGALKKKLDTVAKELEKPKPAPQPQPTAPPQSPPAPSRTQYGDQSTTSPTTLSETTPTYRDADTPPPSTPPIAARAAPVREVAATEVWRCSNESSGGSIKLELRYLRNDQGKRYGYFNEQDQEIDETEGAETNKINKGAFRSDGVNYKLTYADKSRGAIDLKLTRFDEEKGEAFYPNSRYSNPVNRIENIEMLVEVIPDSAYNESEDNGGDFNPLSCNIVKPLYSKYSFEDYSIDEPYAYERYSADIPAIKYFRDKRLLDYKLMIEDAVRSDSTFAKYYIIADGTKNQGTNAFLLDKRSGVILDFIKDKFDWNGETIETHYYIENSNLMISYNVNEVQKICRIVYSKWNGQNLEEFDSDVIYQGDECINDTGISMDNPLQLAEDKKIRGSSTIAQ